MILQTVNNPEKSTTTQRAVLQRKCACGKPITVNGECAECNKEQLKLQRKAVNTQSNPEYAPPIVHEVLRETGRPLDSNTRIFMESRLSSDFSQVKLQTPTHQAVHTALKVNQPGDPFEKEAETISKRIVNQPTNHHSLHQKDFSQIRIHTGAKAAQSAEAINARAYTVGHNVVFGGGQFHPQTSSGLELLAHELTHTIQQKGGVTDTGMTNNPQIIQRKEVSDPQDSDPIATECPILPSPNGDWAMETWLCEMRQELPGSNERLLAFGAKGRSVELLHQVLQHWSCGPSSQDYVKHKLADPNSDFFDGTTFNVVEDFQRWAKKERNGESPIDGIVGPLTIKSLDAYVGGPTQSFICRPDPIPETPKNSDNSEKRCGPNVTEWLINQMNVNQNHPVIRTGRENDWARWIPVFNVGWTIAAFKEFADLVGPGRPWDFKRTQSWWRFDNGRSCPTKKCDRTVTLCGHCVNYDVPGNIHYGWVGRRMEISPWALHKGAGSVQEGNNSGDDPPDTVAINIGIAMADNGKALCDEVKGKLNQLNLHRTKQCPICTQR